MNDFVEGLVQIGPGTKALQPLRLLRAGRADLDGVLVTLVADVLEGLGLAMDLAPDLPGQHRKGASFSRGQIEVFIAPLADSSQSRLPRAWSPPYIWCRTCCPEPKTRSVSDPRENSVQGISLPFSGSPQIILRPAWHVRWRARRDTDLKHPPKRACQFPVCEAGLSAELSMPGV